MAVMNGLFTLGRDADVRQTNGGDDVATLALAYNYGRKQDGQQPTQWIRATLWGKRASSLAPYLVKGKQIFATLDDVHIREYESNGKTGVSLEAKIVDLEFARGQKQEGADQGYGGNSSQRQPARAPAPQRQASSPSASRSGFDDMDSDIPFSNPLRLSSPLHTAI